MELNEQQVTELARQYLAGTASEEDRQRLHHWYDTVNPGDTEMVLTSVDQTSAAFGAEMLVELKKMIAAERSAIPTAHRVHFLKTSWFRYAAAVVLLLGGAAMWWNISQNDRHFEGARNERRRNLPDIQPGTNRAILTVGNKTIDLATNKTGIAVGNVISYTDGEKITDAGQLLQLTTPRGGQYQAVLPDGSKVWLNAASSIKFPSAFKGDRREVEITGEAYLEIAKNTKQPFFVHTNKTDIQVLGTSFNVNAYENEAVEKTTLIEGSIRVINDGAGVILKPGQQAKLTNNQLSIINNQSEAAIAWKNGAFNFDGLSLEEAMKQLERWYDLDVVYEKGVPDIRFYGAISRSLSLESLLKALKETDIHYRIENNRRLIILP